MSDAPLPPGGPTQLPGPAGRWGRALIFGLSAALVVALFAWLSCRVSPILLAAGLALYLLAAGLLLLRQPRTVAPAPDLWRDLVPCYLSVQDASLRIIDTNAQFRRDFGDRLGEHCFRAYKQRSSPCPNCPVLKTFADGQNHTGEEIVVTRDGETAQVIVYSTPLQVEQGRVSAVMEMSTNITEVKRLQRQLTTMGLAVAGMAHRIKNILMGLEGGIFVVNTGFETDDRATVDEGWEMVERNVAKVSRLVKDMLYCSKTREPRFADDVSPAEIVTEVYKLFRARATNEAIDLRLEVSDGGLHGRFDPEGLHNLVNNLAANAIDACRFDPTETKKHTIVLRCLAGEEGQAVIEVSDNGVGIPEDAQQRMFEEFFSTKGTEGTGLGLLVVQQVVQEHDGVVTFSSSPGQGTTFCIRLPCGAASASSARRCLAP